ncbi:MAG TPA: hypothetical protein VG826_33140 [Pirellulales bacterium]|nr:hypothetical protein [Pirellulales bacterium]
MKVDVAILNALAEEKEAITRELKKRCDLPLSYSGEKGRRYEVYTLPVNTGTTIRVATCPLLNVGPIAAAVGTSHMTIDISPTITILVGIAAGNPEHCDAPELGSVVIGTRIYDYVLRKDTTSGPQANFRPFNCEPVLLGSIDEWKRASTWHRRVDAVRPDGNRALPKTTTGAVLSGSSVLADPDRRRALIDETPDRDLVAFEMEAAGVAAVLAQDPEHNSFLFLKGVSDYGDAGMSDSNPNKDKWREYAASAAAVCTIELLSESLGSRLAEYRPRADPKELFATKTRRALECFLESYNESAPFLRATADAIRRAAVDEISDIAMAAVGTARKGQAYRAEIGGSQQFLIRAKGIFGPATKIFAFSLDNVSTFWMSAPTQTVSTYIANHAGGKPSNPDVMRTFVFSTPRAAHQHAARLDYHAKHFPNTFVCSKEHYELLLDNEMLANRDEVGRWLKGDFALLEYDAVGDVRYFADLEGGDVIGLQPIQGKGGVTCNIRVDDVRAMCEDFASLCVGGEIRMVKGVPMLKWVPGLVRPRDSDSRKRWADLLRLMFPQTTAEVLHLTGVTLRADQSGYKEFREALARLTVDLGERAGSKSLVERYRIKQIRLAKRIKYDDNAPRDGVTNGRLHYAKGDLPEDVVVIGIAEEGHLRGFLADRAHLILRLGLFLAMAKTNARLEKVLADNKICSVADLEKLGARAKEVYEEIEEAAALWRMDLRDDELIQELVGQELPRFG